MENLNELKPVGKLSPFAHFCCTIGNLPTSYMISLTYEEQLLWLCNYLEKTVIPAVNTNAEAVAELQNLYVVLKNYVDNYFNNLDVQDEINKKLDEMAQNGTLQEIITQYINSTALWCFDNVEQMKQETNLINGSYTKTNGYYSINDGGQAFYKIRELLENEIIDNGSIIELNNGLVAEIIFDKIVNVNQFGAYGDNIHNDTIAIENAINFAEKNNLTLLFLEGKEGYITDKTLNIKNNVEILSPIQYTGTKVGLIIGDTEKTIGHKKYTVNINSSNNAFQDYESVGIQFINIFNSQINIESVSNFYNGVQFIGINGKGTQYNTININEISNYKIGLTLLDKQGTSRGWVNENTFNKGRIHNNSEFIYFKNEIAILITSENNYLNNNNIFNDTCLELNKIAIQIDYGKNNYFYNIRTENVEIALKCTNNSFENYAFSSYGNYTYEGNTVNVIENDISFIKNKLNNLIFDSGDIRGSMASSGESYSTCKKLYSYKNFIPSTLIEGKVDTNGLKINYYAGVEIDTSNSKIFYVQADSTPARLCLLCFDKNGNLCEEAPTGIYLTFTNIQYNNIQQGLRIWTYGNNKQIDDIVKVPDNCVKCFMFIAKFSTDLILRRVKIFTEFSKKHSGENMVNYSSQANFSCGVLDRIPDSIGKTGQLVLSANPSSTNCSGWIYNGNNWIPIPLST